MYRKRKDKNMFFRYLILFILIFLIYRVIKNALLGAGKSNPVKGQGREEPSFQDKHKNKIEDAEFEEIDD